MVSAKDTRLAILNARITVAMMRADLLLKRFTPNQPRVPAGTATGGQRVQVTGSVGKWVQDTEPSDQRIRLAGVRRLTEDECEELYKRDTSIVTWLVSRPAINKRCFGTAIASRARQSVH